ncbi:MAG: TerB N-terminal domain-containing protein [Ruminococcus sp.]|nr:TerB N-terminal domain-containing protein [Ruminococcus sp.]
MSDVKDILDSVLHDEKLLGSRAFRDKVYTDQPILKRASQIQTPETPQKIKDMKALAYTPEAYWKTSAWLFYTQGRFMEDFSDVYEYTSDFVRYYPTYRDLETEQLRGFFSWRARLWKNEYAAAPIPFVYMRAYELINGIGAESPQERIVLLKRLAEAYGGTNAELKKHLHQWTVDYCVYEQLDPQSIADMPDMLYDSSLLRLLNWEESSDDELFAALDYLSGYPFGQSRYYIANAAEFKTAAVRVFRSLSEFFRGHRKKSLCDKLFGHPTEMNCRLFESAVFYDRNTVRSTDYTLNLIHTYTCRNGVWRCYRYYGSRSRSQQLGELMKMLDHLMRERYDFRYRLRPAEVSKSTAELIKKVLDEIDAEKRLSEAKRIEIDLSKLAGIRAAADVTRDRLIVDEEPDVPTPEPENFPVKADEAVSDTPLDDSERLFLRVLLEGGDWSSAAKGAGVMPSLLADSINDKLYDVFADTVIDCTADVPEVIADYAEELKNYI